MLFGDIALEEAEGTILAHSVRLKGLSLKKGQRIEAAHLEALKQAGLRSVIAARLDPTDIGENEAAARLAAALAGPGLRVEPPHTGRVNLFASVSGVLRLDRGRIDALNRVDDAITAATLVDFAAVQEGQMVATIKIIPLAAPATALETCIALAQPGDAPECLSVHPFRSRRVGLVQTLVSGTKESVLDKTRHVTEQRLAALGARIVDERRCPHEAAAVRGEIGALLDMDIGLLLLIGASAIIDRRDVLPCAVDQAGGMLHRFGMPVDPGNLLMLAQIGDIPVLGLPGCARSRKLNGFDWVLERLCADIAVSSEDIGAMGVGGLLTEIPTRPHPRTAPVSAKPRIAVIVLAAGQSRRMGVRNKLLEPLNGKPMLGHAVQAAIDSRAVQTLVVTGHEAGKVEAALGGLPSLSSLPVRLVHCPDAREGLSRSLRAGIAALSPEIDAAIVCLGDMPYVSAGGIDALIEAYDPSQGDTIIVTTYEGKRGNPVLWDRRYFAEISHISGDVGARHLIGAYDEAVREVAADGARRLVDIDTPEALATAQSAGQFTAQPE